MAALLLKQAKLQLAIVLQHADACQRASERCSMKKSMSKSLQQQALCSPGCCELHRYLYTHAVQNPQYSTSVYSIYAAINSPVVYNSTFPSQLENGITTQLGNADGWVDYLGTCKLT